MTLYIGLMSGTSMDGIDAALVDVSSNTLIHGLTKNYSSELKIQLHRLIENQTSNLASFCQVNTLIGREFADAVMDLLRAVGVGPDKIHAIGSHGQTICHNLNATPPYTLQLGCGHTIAALTGIPVIADFRTKDLINGGQGAPFAPLYHQQLFSAPTEAIAVVNIGGIANISYIFPNKKTSGWDLGPGNCLMDAWIYKNQKKDFDADGAWASRGEIIDDLLKSCLEDPFFHLPNPKSIGKEYFSIDWLRRHLKPDYKPVDIQSTLVAVTAQPIADSILSNKIVHKLYLCGGGAHNKQLQARLSYLLPDVTVQSIAAIGVSPDYLEAMMFAWLAAQTLNKVPVDLSAITGSKGPSILGACYFS